MFPRRSLAATVIAVALLTNACGSSDDQSQRTSTTRDAAIAEEIVSPDADPIEIDAPNDVIPEDEAAPEDDFAIGESTPTDPKGRPFLQQGDEGDDVAALQARLLELGFAVEDGGIFDDATLAAVLTFQRGQRLVADGVVGTKTWAALDAATPGQTVPATTTTPTGDGTVLPALEPPTDDPAKESVVDRVEVSLANQRVRLLAKGRVVAEYPVSSGRNGLTPKGSFRVQSKSPRAWSSSDPSISMVWMTRFSGGIGFHGIPVKGGVPLATPLGERPVSAGCVRMADDAARALYNRVAIGTLVVVS